MFTNMPRSSTTVDDTRKRKAGPNLDDGSVAKMTLNKRRRTVTTTNFGSPSRPGFIPALSFAAAKVWGKGREFFFGNSVSLESGNSFTMGARYRPQQPDVTLVHHDSRHHLFGVDTDKDTTRLGNAPAVEERSREDDEVRLLRVENPSLLPSGPGTRRFRITTAEKKERDRREAKPKNILKRLRESNPEAMKAFVFGKSNAASSSDRKSKDEEEGHQRYPVFKGNRSLFSLLKFDLQSPTVGWNGTPPSRHVKRMMAVQECVRIDDKERYKLLVDQFTPSRSRQGKWAEATSASASSKGLNALPQSPFFNRSAVTNSSAITRTQASVTDPKHLKAMVQQEQDKHVNQSEPEVIELDKDDDDETSATESTPKNFRQEVIAKASNQASGDLGSWKTNRAKSFDVEVSELLDQYSPRVERTSNVFHSERKPAARTKLNPIDSELMTCKYYSQDYLRDLHDKYNTKANDRKIKMREESTKMQFARERASETAHKEVEERLRRLLSITDVELPEEEKKEEIEELPEITDEMENTIKKLFASNPNQRLVEANNITIYGRDIQNLKGLQWLNDEVVNFYLTMIQARSQTNDNFPKVHVFNTFFYPRLMEKGHSALKRWTKKVDLFKFDLIVVPVHLGMHWCLAVVDLRKPSIRYYDSMGGDNTPCLNALARYLEDEHLDKKGSKFDTSKFERLNVKDIPQQLNGSDCGMFACKFAEYLSRDASISFTQEDMPYFRKRMAYEIVNNSLMCP